jgi:hypothetical protein
MSKVYNIRRRFKVFQLKVFRFKVVPIKILVSRALRGKLLAGKLSTDKVVNISAESKLRSEVTHLLAGARPYSARSRETVGRDVGRDVTRYGFISSFGDITHWFRDRITWELIEGTLACMVIGFQGNGKIKKG